MFTNKSNKRGNKLSRCMSGLALIGGLGLSTTSALAEPDIKYHGDHFAMYDMSSGFGLCLSGHDFTITETSEGVVTFQANSDDDHELVTFREEASESIGPQDEDQSFGVIGEVGDGCMWKIKPSATKVVIKFNGGNDSVKYRPLGDGGQFGRPLEIHGGAGDDYLEGGAMDDEIYGNHGNDLIRGLAGNDRINSGHGNDTVHAGIGDDSVWGSAGEDMIYGDAGNDILYGYLAAGTGSDFDQVFGGDGSDNIYAAGLLVGNNGIDTLTGGSGDDMLHAGNENGAVLTESCNGGGGNDMIACQGLNVRFATLAEGLFIFGTPGDDTIKVTKHHGTQFKIEVGTGNSVQTYYRTAHANAKAITVLLNGGNDTYNGRDGDIDLPQYVHPGFGAKHIQTGPLDDVVYPGRVASNDSPGNYIYGGVGNDQLYGTNGEDEIDGFRGYDLIEGFQGKDKLYGGLDGDLIVGGGHDDEIDGGDGHDYIIGDCALETDYRSHYDACRNQPEGDDILLGREGADVIIGNRGRDFINGNQGNDLLIGGVNDKDEVLGGPGQDFILDSNSHNFSDAAELRGNDGRDLILVAGAARLKGGDSNDVLLQISNSQWFYLDPDAKLFGGQGGDLLYSTDFLPEGSCGSNPASWDTSFTRLPGMYLENCVTYNYGNKVANLVKDYWFHIKEMDWVRALNLDTARRDKCDTVHWASTIMRGVFTVAGVWIPGLDVTNYENMCLYRAIDTRALKQEHFELWKKAPWLSHVDIVRKYDTRVAEHGNNPVVIKTTW